MDGGGQTAVCLSLCWSDRQTAACLSAGQTDSSLSLVWSELLLFVQLIHVVWQCALVQDLVVLRCVCVSVCVCCFRRQTLDCVDTFEWVSNGSVEQNVNLDPDHQTPRPDHHDTRTVQPRSQERNDISD